MSNHNAWHTCTNCGEEFDRRIESNSCPKCQTKVSTRSSDIMLVIIVLIILIVTGCATPKHHVRSNLTVTEKLQKKVRHHKNRIAQETIQYQSSIPAGKDWTRMYRNRDRRPTGSWPFEFLQ